jgi:hypothetical protein
MLATHEQEPVILEGIPIYPPKRRRLDLEAPPAPPPMEVQKSKRSSISPPSLNHYQEKKQTHTLAP